MEMIRPEELIKAIIKEQGLIIGEDLAVARAVSTGLIKPAPEDKGEVTVTGNNGVVLEKLVDAYKQVFGQSSVDVCLDVIRRYPMVEISSILPDSLKGKVAAKK